MDTHDLHSNIDIILNWWEPTLTQGFYNAKRSKILNGASPELVLKEDHDFFTQTYLPLLIENKVTMEQYFKFFCYRYEQKILSMMVEMTQELYSISLEIETRLVIQRCLWTRQCMQYFFPGEGYQHVRNLIAYHTLTPTSWSLYHRLRITEVDAIQLHIENKCSILEQVYDFVNDFIAIDFYDDVQNDMEQAFETHIL